MVVGEWFDDFPCIIITHQIHLLAIHIPAYAINCLEAGVFLHTLDKKKERLTKLGGKKMFCPNCGTKILEENSTFCPNCQTSIRRQSSMYGDFDDEVVFGDVFDKQGKKISSQNERENRKNNEIKADENEFAIISIICGVISIVFSPIMITIVAGIAAIILANISNRSYGPVSAAKAGKICGIIGIIMSCVCIVSIVALFIVGLGLSGVFNTVSASGLF